jgi:anti-sigma regulatory factor (Ser/Thr protein kinase)
LALDELRRALERARARAAERQRQNTRAEVRLRLRSDPRHLAELHEKLATLFHAAGLSILQVQHLTVAVRELAANAIEWGHRNQPDRLVAIVCRIEPDRVTVDVRDSGPGFNPRDLPHAACAGDPLGHLPARAARNLREGGFGILLASGLVDELRYNDAGNEARLVMHFVASRCRGAARP